MQSASVSNFLLEKNSANQGAFASIQAIAGTERALNSLGLALICVDDELKEILWVSQACRDLRTLSEWRAGQRFDQCIQDLDMMARALQSEDSRTHKPTPIYVRTCANDMQESTILRAWCTKLPDDTVAIRLEDALEQQEAAVRHLNDRERLMQISRTVSIGEMATTVAHELNQPIGAISNLLQGLDKRLENNKLDTESARAAIQRGIRHAQYAGAVIQRVREYVNRHEPQVSVLDVPNLVDDALQLLDWELVRGDVRVECSIEKDLPEVRGDKVMLQQVLVNLLRNAIEAMQSVHSARRVLTISVAVQGAELVTQVCDQGVGLTHDQGDKLFTAFFSSKPGGMGVGLHICRTIIEMHHGRLWFTRNANDGTTFHIALPHWGAEHG